MLRLIAITFFVLATSLASATPQTGYHYAKPAKAGLSGYIYQNAPPSSYGTGGHFFPPLSTVRPLPVVPNLPALPTPRSTATLHQQALFQSHPPPAATPSAPRAPHSNVGKIVQQYRPPTAGLPATPTSFGSRFGGPEPRPVISNPPTPPSGRGGSFLLGTFAPSSGGASARGPQPPAAQPLRIPFGKTAVVHYPGGQTGVSAPSSPSAPSGPSGPSNPQNFGNGAGRPLKQYAVIEIIDNDIMQNTQPFLPPQVPDTFRAQIGASGTGAIAPPSAAGVQITSRANANVLEQQRQATQGSGANNISLGSGGLGLVRLPNGNVHLGSGSLGYVSSQQIRDNANDARTRSEMARASALHFGHHSLAESEINGTGSVEFPNSNRF